MPRPKNDAWHAMVCVDLRTTNQRRAHTHTQSQPIVLKFWKCETRMENPFERVRAMKMERMNERDANNNNEYLHHHIVTHAEVSYVSVSLACLCILLRHHLLLPSSFSSSPFRIASLHSFHSFIGSIIRYLSISFNYSNQNQQNKNDHLAALDGSSLVWQGPKVLWTLRN